MRDYKPFRFKQFSIRQNHAAMKVGTDGILLGAWTNIKTNDGILDIGTGTGLLSIMLAQKVHGNCRIDALEIDDNAIIDAQYNIDNSPWSNSIQLIHNDFYRFQSKVLYDVIISNPPFYEGNASSNHSRASARSSGNTLDLNDLIIKSAKLLKPNGRLFLIIPYEIKDRLIQMGTQNQLKVSSILAIRPTPTKTTNRAILEFSKHVSNPNPTEYELIVQDENGVYSEAFKKVTNSYYLDI